MTSHYLQSLPYCLDGSDTVGLSSIKSDNQNCLIKK